MTNMATACENLFFYILTMRPLHLLFAIICIYIIRHCYPGDSIVEIASSPIHPHPPHPHPNSMCSMKKYGHKLFILLLLFLTLLSHCWFTICNLTRFLPLESSMNMLSKRCSNNYNFASCKLYVLCTLMSLFELDELQIITFISVILTDELVSRSFVNIINKKPIKIPLRVRLGLFLIALFSFSESHISHALCILVLTLSCLKIFKKNPHWIFYLLIILSHDVHENPGPNRYQNSFFQIL